MKDSATSPETLAPWAAERLSGVLWGKNEAHDQRKVKGSEYKMERLATGVEQRQIASHCSLVRLSKNLHRHYDPFCSCCSGFL